MKVRITKTTAGASGNIRPGSIIDVSETEGKLLLKIRYAETLEPKPETPKKRKGK